MTAVADPIIVTEAAANKITQLLDEEKKKDAGLRVFVQGGGCSGFQYGLMIEAALGTPRSTRSSGRTVLRSSSTPSAFATSPVPRLISSTT